jgi:hypothetical protein
MRRGEMRAVLWWEHELGGRKKGRAERPQTSRARLLACPERLESPSQTNNLPLAKGAWKKEALPTLGRR